MGVGSGLGGDLELWVPFWVGSREGTRRERSLDEQGKCTVPVAESLCKAAWACAEGCILRHHLGWLPCKTLVLGELCFVR